MERCDNCLEFQHHLIDKGKNGKFCEVCCGDSKAGSSNGLGVGPRVKSPVELSGHEAGTGLKSKRVTAFEGAGRYFSFEHGDHYVCDLDIGQSWMPDLSKGDWWKIWK